VEEADDVTVDGIVAASVTSISKRYEPVTLEPVVANVQVSVAPAAAPEPLAPLPHCVAVAAL
jgi:hypothetical protein